MEKRGQLTVFIILGILVVVFAVIAIILTRQQVKPTQDVLGKQVRVEQLTPEDYVQYCVAQTALKAVFFFGFIGGDVKPDPNPYYFRYDDYYMLPYWYFKGKSYLPTKSEAEQKYLSQYVNGNLKSCLDWSKLPGVSATMGNVRTTATIAPKNVVFLVNMPVTVTQGTQVRQLEPDYTSAVNVRLNDVLSIAKTIVDREVQDDLFIHWDYLTEVTKQDFNITAYTEADETIVYKLLDLENSLYENKPYVFQWANKIKTVEP